MCAPPSSKPCTKSWLRCFGVELYRAQHARRGERNGVKNRIADRADRAARAEAAASEIVHAADRRAGVGVEGWCRATSGACAASVNESGAGGVPLGSEHTADRPATRGRCSGSTSRGARSPRVVGTLRAR